MGKGMSNKEAIHELIRCRRILEGVGYIINAEAFDLAISALEGRNKEQYIADPWDGVKPHAPDGFYEKYCNPYASDEKGDKT